MPHLIWIADSNLVHAVGLSPWWLRLLVPVAGSLLAGLVLDWGIRWSAPARGWDILEAVVVRDGVLHPRPALVKCVSSLLTVASAGAIGREGPMVLLSATTASFAGRRLGLPTRQLRTIVACGIAAGIACAYNTPIGAALFTMEIILGDFALEILAPLAFASVVATLISRSVFGSFAVFRIPEFSLTSPWEIGPFMLLGVLGGATAAAFLAMLRWWAQPTVKAYDDGPRRAGTRCDYLACSGSRREWTRSHSGPFPPKLECRFRAAPFRASPVAHSCDSWIRRRWRRICAYVVPWSDAG